MKVALFVGDHAADTLLVRAGWWLTRKFQQGPYARVTHVEGILDEYADGSVLIGSASLRDGGVRDKTARLNPSHWIIADVPRWDVSKSIAHMAKMRGKKYDSRGAVASVFLGSQDPGREFCNEHVGAPHLLAAGTFSPSQFAAICLTLGTDVTEDFFKARTWR